MKKILPIIIIFILILVIKNNVSSILKDLENENTAANLKKDLAEQEKTNRFLKERLFYVKTNQFIEEEAREKLGMVKSGEYIVIAPTAAMQNREKIVVDEKSNWRKWWELFF